MNKALLRGLAVSALVVLLVPALTGCWNPFAPDEGGEDPPPIEAQYRLRTSPQNVIHNLNTSYVYMNATEYLDCLAEDFLFFLNPDDLTADPTLPPYWEKHVEEQIHLNMFGDGTDVEGIALIFTHEQEIFDDNGTSDIVEDDTWTYVEDVDLRVQLPPDLTLHAAAPARFLFRVDQDQTGPNGEMLWEIWKQWDENEESRSEPGGDTGTGETTLTKIKARFRE
jgi:hypothetical protein